MGGAGSGRWGGHRKAQIVEECRALDLRSLARESGFQPGRHGVVDLGESGAIGYKVDGAATETRRLILNYQVRVNRDSEYVQLPIRLERMAVHFGGSRWWGRCPLGIDGLPCGRRVAKLYLPPDCRYFGCQHCYGLTYRSKLHG